MRKVTTSEFRKNIHNNLNELPVAIVKGKRGELKAIVLPIEDEGVVMEIYNKYFKKGEL